MYSPLYIPPLYIVNYSLYTSSLLQYQVIGWGFPISSPPLYYAGTKISSDPKPCQGLDKAVIKMTEYE
jgi:hypothetical protein